MNTPLPSFLSGALIAVAAVAQGPGLDSFRTPIHSLDAEYGVWAAGPSYKARFDGGFAYYPVLGRAYPENLPFVWRTRSVRVGALELVDGGPADEKRVGDFRFEYRHAAFVEAYDVRLDGVEQTFVLRQRPASDGGDLVVVGEVSGPLECAPIAPRQQALVFRGPAGERIVEYGAATAIDATGRKFAMTSAFDGESIELRLDAAALALAEFPLVVDPIVGNDPIRDAGRTAVAAVPQPGATDPNGMSVYTRINSASDHDVFGVLTRPGFGLVSLAFVDLSPSYSSQEIAVGSFDPDGKILIAAERRQGFTTSLEFYIHDVTNIGLRSGVSTVLNAAVGEHFRHPAIGGTKEGIIALLVYDYTQPGTGDVTIEGRRVLWNGAHTPLGATIGAQTPWNHERKPSITPYTSNLEGWVVAWAHSDSGSGHIFGRKVFEDGLLQVVVEILHPSSNNIYRNTRVAGGNGRFLVTWQQGPTGIGIPSFRARRFDWPNGGSVTQLDSRSILGGQSVTNGGLAHDFETRSHWISAYTVSTGPLTSEVRATRIGFQCRTVQTEVVDSVGTPHIPSIAFNGRPGDALYDILYAELNGANNSVRGEPYEYPAAAYVHTRFNSGCGFADDDESDPALAGSQFWSSRLLQHDDMPAALFYSRLSTTLPLDLIGMTGCIMSVEPALTISIPATLNGAHQYEVKFPLGEGMANLTFFTQWAWISPAANSLGVVLNSGVAHQAL